MRFGINSTDKLVSHWLLNSKTEKVVAIAETLKNSDSVSNNCHAQVLVNGIELDFEDFDKFLNEFCQSAYGKICGWLDAMENEMLQQIRDSDIKWLSPLARNRCVKRGL